MVPPMTGHLVPPGVDFPNQSRIIPRQFPDDEERGLDSSIAELIEQPPRDRSHSLGVQSFQSRRDFQAYRCLDTVVFLHIKTEDHPGASFTIGTVDPFGGHHLSNRCHVFHDTSYYENN